MGTTAEVGDSLEKDTRRFESSLTSKLVISHKDNPQNANGKDLIVVVQRQLYFHLLCLVDLLLVYVILDFLIQIFE